MDHRLTASKLIRFGPRSDDALPEQPEPTHRLSVAIETELRGVRTRVQADGSRLFTELTVAFSRFAASICNRVRMTGLVPANHAEPTGLGSLAYNGSTCGIVDATTPVPLYRQASVGMAWTLALNWPANNLYALYGNWPRATYVVEPGLTTGERAPIITLSLERFASFSGDSADGVAYPMSLIIDMGSSIIEIARLNRESSPQITGGAGALTGRENPFWEITSDEIADAMAGLVPGTYPIDLIIYKGHGQQIYRGHCRSFAPEDLDPNLPPPLGDTADLGEWTSSQGGDYGIFEVARVPALMVAWMNAPPAFRYTAGGANRDLSLEGASVGTSAIVGTDYWYGTHSGEPVALSWESGVIVQDRMTYSAPGVRAAAMVDTPSGPALIYGTVQVSGAINVRMIRNGRDDLIAAGTPGHTSTTPDMAFSPSGDLRLMFVVPATQAANAIVYECTLGAMPAETVNPGTGQVVAPSVAGLGWGLVSNMPIPSEADSVQSESNFSSGSTELGDPGYCGIYEVDLRQVFREKEAWYSSSSSSSGQLECALGAYYSASGELKLCRYNITYEGQSSEGGSSSEIWRFTCSLGFWSRGYVGPGPGSSYGQWSFAARVESQGVTAVIDAFNHTMHASPSPVPRQMVYTRRASSAKLSRPTFLVGQTFLYETMTDPAVTAYLDDAAAGTVDAPNQPWAMPPRTGGYQYLLNIRNYLRTGTHAGQTPGPSSVAAFGVVPAVSINNTIFMGGSQHTAGASPTRLIPVTPSQCPGQTDHPPIPNEWPTMGTPPEAFVDINDAREAAGVSRLSNSGALVETAAATAEAIIAELETDAEAQVRAPTASALVAIGVDSQAHAIEAWIASPAHKARLIAPGWVAVGVVVTDSPRGLLVVAHFSQSSP